MQNKWKYIYNLETTYIFVKRTQIGFISQIKDNNGYLP